MTETQQQGPQVVAAERDGSRWIYSKPPQDDVVAWFREQHLHADMEHDPYLGGIVLIPATEKVKETRRMPNGMLTPFEYERIVYTPYVKVDTRIAYFWDFVRALNGGKLLGEFVGVIEPVEQKIITDEKSPYFNAHLPQGFSVYVVRNKNDTVSRYIVSTMRVAVYERQAYAARARPAARSASRASSWSARASPPPRTCRRPRQARRRPGPSRRTSRSPCPPSSPQRHSAPTRPPRPPSSRRRTSPS
jgi:hypothetical protein